MENIYWKKTVGTLIGSIWLYTLAGIAAGIMGMVNDLLNPVGIMGMMQDMMRGDESSMMNIGDLAEYLFILLMFCGYWFFFCSLSRFIRLQTGVHDRECVSRIRKAYLLLMMACLVGFIPVLGGVIAFVLMLVGYFNMLSGYRGLANSETFPAGARSGAALLRTCTIWMMVGYVLGCVPILGGIIGGIISLVVFFLILRGWGAIRQSALFMSPEEEEAFAREEQSDYKRVLGNGLIALFSVFIVQIGWSVLIKYNGFSLEGLFQFYGSESLNLLLITRDWPVIPIAVVYAYLLASSKIQLRVWGRVGLVLLLLNSLGRMIISYMAFSGIGFEWGRTLEYISVALSGLSLGGWLLFIWGSRADLAIRIVVSLFPFVERGILWIRSLHMEAMPDYDREYCELLYKQYALVSLIVTVIFLLVICLLVNRWRKKPDGMLADVGKAVTSPE